MLIPLADGDLRIGIEPSWRLRDGDGRWRRLLERVDGIRTWDQITLGLSPLERSAAGRLLDILADLGLAHLGAGPRRRSSSHRLRLVGAGPLAAALLPGLLDIGVDPVHLVDPVDHGRAADLREQHGERVRLVRHWTKPESPRVPLTVVVADSWESDRTITADLLRHDAPHLLVRPRPTGAVVGPLVVPGRTCCLHCTDLHRRDADPDWPELLGRLRTRTARPCPPAVVVWTVATTLNQVLTFHAGARPETHGATVELADHAMSWRSWAGHPECGCRWATGSASAS